MEEDFNQSIDECLIIDFDPKFPLKKKTETEQDRKKEVLNILKAMWNNQLIPKKYQDEKSEEKSEPKLAINFDIEKKIINSNAKIYEKQLTALGKKISAEPDLLKMLAIGFVYTFYIFNIGYFKDNYVKYINNNT